MIDAFILNLVILFLIYFIVAIGLNISLGFTGLLNLGHIGFYGIGAYVSALLMKSVGLSFLPSFLIAGATTGVVGYLLIAGIRHLKGDYLALATLGFNYVVFAIFLNWIAVTGGPFGISAIPKPVILGWEIDTRYEYLILVLVIAVIIFTLSQILVKSRYGKLLEAVRDNEIAVEALGKDTGRLKIQAMMISAVIAGFGGSLFAHYINFVDASIISIHSVVFILTIIILGGLATLKGTFYATLIVVFLPEMLRFVDLPNEIVSPMQQIIYAFVLILILMYRPRGLFGKVELK